MKTFRIAAVVSALVALTGCPSKECTDGSSCSAGGGNGGNGGNGGGNAGGNGGNGGGGDTIDAGPPITIADYCAKSAEAVCDKAIRCNLVATDDKVACIALVSDGCEAPRQVAAGIATFDGAAAAQCVARYALQDCFDNTTPTVCGTAVKTGGSPPGTSCTSSTTCRADAGDYCAFNDFATCQQCASRVGLGAFCAFDVDIRCQPGLTCNETGGDGGHCVAPVGPGTACNASNPCQNDAGFCPPAPTDGGARLCQPLGGEGSRCTSSTQCAPPRFCNLSPGDGGTAFFCENRRNAGDPCTSSTQCTAPLYCPTTGMRICTAPLADGAGCTLASQCMANYCNRDPFDFDDDVDAGPRRCGFLMTNEECYVNDDCGAGKHCKGYVYQRPDAGSVAGVCAQKDPDGGACTNSATLFSDSCANPQASCLDSLCVVTPPYSRKLGDTCDNTGQCGSASRCDKADPLTYEGHCVALLDNGIDCEEDNDCKLGSYCDLDNTGKCTPYARRTEMCDDTNGPYCAPIENCNVNTAGDGTCGPYVTTGAMCNNLNGPLCYSSFCQADAGACVAKLPTGTACLSDSNCATGSCGTADGGDDVCLAACY